MRIVSPFETMTDEEYTKALLELRGVPHPYFKKMLLAKENLLIGFPSDEFWEAWKEAKRIKYKDSGSMIRFRTTWGMLKEDINETDRIFFRFNKMLNGRISDWSPTNRFEKDRCENFPWLIAIRKESLITEGKQ